MDTITRSQMKFRPNHSISPGQPWVIYIELPAKLLGNFRFKSMPRACSNKLHWRDVYYILEGVLIPDLHIALGTAGRTTSEREYHYKLLTHNDKCLASKVVYWKEVIYLSVLLRTSPCLPSSKHRGISHI